MIEWLKELISPVEIFTILDTSVRTVVIFISALIMIRTVSKRFLGQYAAFDVILGIIIGSTFSRAINGNAHLRETVIATLVLVAFHWFVSFLAYHSKFWEHILEEETIYLIKNGEIQWKSMHKNHISERDLTEALRGNSIEDVGRVKSAFLERNGSISVIPFREEPRILEVSVRNGVQTVRIELH